MTHRLEIYHYRILQASSNEGDIVLDGFCGCGTTLVAAAGIIPNSFINLAIK